MKIKISLFLISLFLIGFLTVENAYADIGIIKKIKRVGNLTVSLAVDSIKNKIYVANALSNDVVVIDGSTDRVVDKIKIPGSIAIDYVATNPSANKLYIVSQNSESTQSILNILDSNTNEVLNAVEISGFEAFGGSLDVNITTNKIYFITYNNLRSNVGVFDELTNQITLISTDDTNDATKKSFLEGIKVNPNTNKIYVSGDYEINGDYLNRDGVIHVIDSTTGTLIKTINIADGPSSVISSYIDIDPLTNKIYVVVQGMGRGYQDEIKIIDGTIDEVIDTIPVKHASSLAVDPSKSILYASLSFDLKESGKFLSIVDLNSKRIIKKLNIKVSPLPFGGHSTTEPFNIVVNPNTHKAYMYIDYAGVIVVGER